MFLSYYTVLFVIAFCGSAFLTPVARLAGLYLGIVDQPDHFRKIHQTPVPLVGGFALYLGFVFAIVFHLIYSPEPLVFASGDRRLIVRLMMGGGLILLMGLVDDLWNLKARWKLMLQIVAAVFAYASGFRVEAISGFSGSSMDLSIFSLPVTVFWFLICMNALNLADGLDGLSAGIGLFVGLTILGVSILAGNLLGIFFATCMSGATLGFLIFNFSPANIFLGDSGSMLLGFLLASISLLTRYKAETATALLIPFTALALPILDMVLAVIRRWARRMPISLADRSHIHHNLLAHGLSQRRAVLVLYSVCALLGGGSMLLLVTRNNWAILVLLCLGTAMVLGIRVFRLVDVSQIKVRLMEDYQHRMWLKQTYLKVEKAIVAMDSESSLESIWHAALAVFKALDLDQVSLQGTLKGRSFEFSWPGQERSLEACEPDRVPDRVSVQLAIQGPDLDAQMAVVKHGELSAIRNMGVLLGRFRGRLALKLASLTFPSSGPGQVLPDQERPTAMR